ncbi:MAG: glycosyltransferase, partial [Acidimicrobiales bacterium]
MTRTTAVTICVVTGTDRRATRDFLDRLGCELGPHDNVALLGETSAGLSEPGAWRLVSTRGDLRRPKDGERPRTRPVVVVVDDRVDAATGWVEILAAALADPTVGVVAPRCNSADGDELFVGVPYRPDEHGSRRSFQRETMESARGRLSDVERLAGPCIAARREVLDGLGGLDAVLAGGFDPAGLARQVSETGRRLVVAESCYVHHPGGPTRRPDPGQHGQPLVSACLIVRDEQENLPRCLESMAGLADEIVVYDTGSTDSTVQIAVDAGARVVRGYWDDDFGRARNDALAGCRGQWILWLDADEALDCDDTAGLRTKLAECPTDVESFILHIDNLVGNEAGSTFTHPACRLFRRAYGHWEGHIHEQVHARAGRPSLSRELLMSARIAHRGYLQSAMNERSKGDRNLRTAFSDLVDGPGLDWSTRLLSLGRSYGMAGLVEESLDHCRDAASQTTNSLELRLARRSIIDALLGLGRTSEALAEIDALRSSLTNQTLADIFEGQARLARKEHEEAVAIFDRVGSSIDEDGFQYSPSMVASAKAEALIELGRHGEAADALLASIRESNGVDAHLGRLIECLEMSGRDLGEIHVALGTGRIETFVPQLLQLEPEAADRTLESWYQLDATSRPILAAAAQVAPKLGIERQLIWSSRLRAAGLDNACPLLRSATDSRAAARYRVLSAAACHTLFGDPRALHAFAAALLATPAPDLGQLRVDISAIAPTLTGYLDDLEPSVAAPATPPAISPSPYAAGVRVLVLDRQCSSLRSISLAGLLATTGYDVTIAQPLPVHPSRDLLGHIDATVRGWSDASPSDGAWLTRCTTALATITAEQRYDVVVVAASAVGAVPALRRLVPAALIAVDLDDATAVPPGADTADLLLSSLGAVAGSGAPVAYAPTVASRLLPLQPRLPLARRSGLCVVANLRQLPSDAAASLRARLEPVLEKAGRESSVTFCGDDPAHLVRDMLPGALVCDPMANPAPHLGAARAVLVCQPAGAPDWVDLARSCGTPVVVLPVDASADGEPIELVMRLLGDDGARSESAGTPTARDDAPLTDPLASVTR